MRDVRYQVLWRNGGVLYAAVEPDAAEIVARSEALSAWYSEPHNRAMMAGSGAVAPGDVAEIYAAMRQAGGRPFHLLRDGALVGDGDFRHIADGRAEFAILIGPRDVQGRGLGTTFSRLLHAFAFAVLHVDDVYLTIVPDNVAGRRCYEKIGYVVDDGALARSYAEDPTDIAMRLSRAAFQAAGGAVLPDVVVEPRPQPR